MARTILALGADIKNRFLLARGNSFCFGPDIGDLSELNNFRRFRKEITSAVKNSQPEVVTCDLHPNYFSSILARELFPSRTLLSVQHHHSHIASVIEEHNLKGPLIGIAFDGTGYGSDGHSWGGEFFIVEKGNFSRQAHLKYRMMPGGDKVVVEPWRMLVSILGESSFDLLKGVGEQDKKLILTMMRKNINSPLSSSAGRLFDAAAALLGICLYAEYEAEGPIKLEALSDEKINENYEFNIVKQNGCFTIDTDKVFLGMFKDLKKGKDKCLIASKFHNSVTEIIIDTVKKITRSFKVKDIALSGGVFQNNFLKKKVIEKLSNLGFNVFTNVKTPVNDLNISLGQYYVSGSSGKS